MKKILVGVLTVIVVLGGGLSVYAYESPDITNGHPLYGLKRSLEGIEYSFAVNDEAKAQYHLKMALRRVDESQVLAARGITDDGTLKTLDEEAQNVMTKFDAIKDPTIKEKVLSLYQNGFTRKLQEMNQIRNQERYQNEERTGTGTITPENDNDNGYKNFGQERSDYVNKGQQGERMKSEIAQQKIKEKVEEKVVMGEIKREELTTGKTGGDDTDVPLQNMEQERQTEREQNGGESIQEQGQNGQQGQNMEGDSQGYNTNSTQTKEQNSEEGQYMNNSDRTEPENNSYQEQQKKGDN